MRKIYTSFDFPKFPQAETSHIPRTLAEIPHAITKIFNFQRDICTNGANKMNREEIIDLLKVHKKDLKKFGVKSIGIFGSVARDESDEKSDVDIVVEFEKGKGTFRNFGGLINYLEKLFDRSVDILTPVGIESIRNDEIKKSIKQGVVYV